MRSDKHEINQQVQKVIFSSKKMCDLKKIGKLMLLVDKGSEKWGLCNLKIASCGSVSGHLREALSNQKIQQNRYQKDSTSEQFKCLFLKQKNKLE
ncbi:hypothetical protein HispidOSU_010939, partial [Sigmodon hispidus]